MDCLTFMRCSIGEAQMLRAMHNLEAERRKTQQQEMEAKANARRQLN